MKKDILLLLCLCLIVHLDIFASSSKKIDSLSGLRTNFSNPPSDVKTAVYWYWISDNISKEGVVKDLQAMKKVGINRAFIGNIGEPSVPYGDVKIFTDEWWDILHTALKTASDLGIEIGIFNSPGWSQSGGPWVKKEQSMRYLASSSIIINGPCSELIQLPEINDAQDVKVLAFPIVDEKKASWKIVKNEGESCSIDMKVPFEVARTLFVKVSSVIKTSAKLYFYKNNKYSLLKEFEIDRSNPAIQVGFDPYAPIVIALPHMKCDSYKLVLGNSGAGSAEVTLSSKAYVERYPEKTLAKMFQTPLPMWDEYLWEDQPEVDDSTIILDPNQIIDLTSKVTEDGKINWNVPIGKWKLVRYAMKTTGQTNAPASPEGTGLEVDKMSKIHLKSHFESFIGEILRRIPAKDRHCFKAVVMDSYETGGLNWTDDMEKSFVEKFGYSPIPYLPVLQGEIIGSAEISNRFLWDLRRLIADRVAYDYVGGLRELCHKYGLTTWLENYGHWGFPSEFLLYGGQSDEIAGEFWSVGSLGDIENRAASSCGHIYGKNKIWAESFTCGGPDFYRYPAEMKPRGDRFFTEGINATLLHLYIQQPNNRMPGINAPYGNEFNRHNIWFSHLDLFINYLKRCNYLLQQGTYVADVAYFIGEDTPKMTGICEPALPKGYSFDYINADVLLNNSSVVNGCLTLESGMKYRVLVLPHLKTMRPEILKKIEEFISNGLIVLGDRPIKSPSLQNYPKADVEVEQLSNLIWNSNLSSKDKSIYGKGYVYFNTNLERIFADLKLQPDFTYSNSSVPLLFIHRKLKNCDIYFVSNQSDSIVSTTATFRVNRKKVELWDPVSAEMRIATATVFNGLSSMELTLQPNESSFIVFHDEKTPALHDIPNFPKGKHILTINSPWSIVFHNQSDRVSKSVIWDNLQDLSTSDDIFLKYFSGSITYKNSFNLNSLPSNEMYIDLGKVMLMAKIKVNGKYVGGVWTSPYKLNISNYVNVGKNTIEVEVVNNWINRLIGDKRLPLSQRSTWNTFTYLTEDTQLQPSGLLGPVIIESYDYELMR